MGRRASMGQGFCAAAFAIGLLALPENDAGAGELAHYSPGLLNIRDLLVPVEPGFYVAQYHYFYTADQFRDRNGNKVDSLPVGSATVDVDADVDVFAVSPLLMWVSPWQILGARYAAYIGPGFTNTTAQASLRTQTGLGLESDESAFGFGDLFVQPLWLGWSGAHFDAALGYGFYAPTGHFENGDDDNIGLGFWTNQFQAAGAFYPNPDRTTALTLGITYELNGNQEDVDVTPGQRISLNYGISHYIPLDEGPTWMAEIGLLGFSQWEIEKDSGSDVREATNVKDQIHAVGMQLGATFLPWKASATFHYLHEYGAEARFQGDHFVLTLGKAF